MSDYIDMENEAEISAQIKHVAGRLKEERERLRISQMDLSFKAGLSQNQVNYIENGKRIPNLYTILCICKALQINPATLFKQENNERQEAREAIIRLVTRFM